MKRVWLWQIRHERGVTQTAAARELGISHSSYAKIEEGIADPKVSTAKRIAQAWGFAWTRFFEEKGENT